MLILEAAERNAGWRIMITPDGNIYRGKWKIVRCGGYAEVRSNLPSATSPTGRKLIQELAIKLYAFLVREQNSTFFLNLKDFNVLQLYSTASSDLQIEARFGCGKRSRWKVEKFGCVGWLSSCENQQTGFCSNFEDFKDIKESRALMIRQLHAPMPSSRSPNLVSFWSSLCNPHPEWTL